MADVYKHDKIGALADGFANSAVNSTEVDDGSTGYVGVANGDNRDNQDNSVDVAVTADISANNGDNRDNDYDWSYDSDDDTKTITDTDTKTITDTDTKTITDTDTKTITDTDTKTITDTDTKTITDTDTKTVSDSYNTSDSFNKTDTDFAVLEDVKDFDNLGIAGGDLTFNIGDDFSFTLDVDSILNNSLGGAGNDSGFSAVQANHLADQDDAWNVRMDNAGANNNLNSNGGTADSAEGMEMDGRRWDLDAGDDASGSSAADASAILANSGFHLELVQGANLLSNTVDSSVIGGNSTTSDVGEDTGT
ncbi:fibrinogen-binding protein [Rhizobium sp. R634]|uniref:fibrinogen-binding protein n=1 Tax=Rhizobium sp. R634 TaxID=1764274 RepID=UPI000B52B480|nr:fibrinogen-binding protein [Rhizobium sp. R634]OWV81239.1 fibrinogen-binding protein [Rhizobium sp. R634]